MRERERERERGWRWEETRSMGRHGAAPSNYFCLDLSRRHNPRRAEGVDDVSPCSFTRLNICDLVIVFIIALT